ncbi:Aspartyl aminopeptidase like protein [Verticillium longisporum]|uniref:aspartyl aminopeptidase n=1 Tax=Verticillium longisporum TaxID=100787 RepID=A0A8I3APA0_VERLO|nr:Aspartyl aminopeptidase like protein [Verticillium longisporum]
MAPDKTALDFIDFVNASPTPYHACANAAARLEKAGFSKIKERDSWASTLRPGGKYYLTRNGSSIVAFAIGKKWRPGNPVGMIGAHTDSPCLRIKPDSTGTFTQKLIKVDKPLLRIPTLAIHLDRSSSFDPNKEVELFPIAGLASAELNKSASETQVEGNEETEEDFKPLRDLTERHHPHIIDVIASHAEVDVSNVVDFELVLYDTQPACLGGLNDEFVFSPRLDNLGMTYCSIMGLITSLRDSAALDEDHTIRLVTCFDHEEIGSTSAQGANSNLLPAILRRLSVLPAGRSDTASDASYDSVNDAIPHLEESIQSTAYEQTLSRSFLVSADMAHSVHPNYAGKYEASHQPAMNGGTVIKINANQRARHAGVPLQLAKLGVRTLDLGNPQLSMHSIRETGGSKDVEFAVRLFESFYERYGELEEKILVD